MKIKLDFDLAFVLRALIGTAIGIAIGAAIASAEPRSYAGGGDISEQFDDLATVYEENTRLWIEMQEAISQGDMERMRELAEESAARSRRDFEVIGRALEQ